MLCVGLVHDLLTGSSDGFGMAVVHSQGMHEPRVGVVEHLVVPCEEPSGPLLGILQRSEPPRVQVMILGGTE